MTQDSWPWNCSPLAGDAGAVTVNDLVNANQLLGNTAPNGDGVIYWTSTNPLVGGTAPVDGLLEPSLAGDVVTIASGVGAVQGWLYVNTDDVDFDFAATPGNANATDLIVLERGDPTSTLSVRLARVQGAVSSVATVTQSEALWQVAIAQVALDGSGLPTSITDVRSWVNEQKFFFQGGDNDDWSVAGTTDYQGQGVTIYGGTVEVTVSAGNTEGQVTVTLPREIHGDKITVQTTIARRAVIDVTSTKYASFGAKSAFGVADLLISASRMDGTTLGGDITLVVQWQAIAGMP